MHLRDKGGWGQSKWKRTKRGESHENASVYIKRFIKSLIYKQLAIVMRFFVDFIKMPDLFKLSAVRK